jgi:hypothetical protein
VEHDRVDGRLPAGPLGEQLAALAWAPIATAVVFGVWAVVRNLPFAPFLALRV